MDDLGLPQDVGQVVGEVGSEVVAGIKKVGQTATGQVIGQQGQPVPSGDDVAGMKQKDEKFSERAQEEIRARMRAIYGEHAAKSRRRATIEKQQDKQVEVQKQEFSQMQKKQSADVTIAQTRASAEMGKNMGGE
ncbi:MAG: hypothetical protein WD988_01170 [Candidatus Curtissbacteria bacterium]